MKTKIILSVMVFSSLIYSSFVGYAQTNLVPNPSFEDYSPCPDNVSQITYATGWNAARVTPDYFNSCSSSSWTSVPNNSFGYKTPASGDAYTGIMARWPFNDGFAETMCAQLATPLIIGEKYYVSFKASLASHFNPSNYCGINKLGALFSTIQYSSSSPSPRCNYDCAQIHTDSIITDTLNWTRIKGSFVADSSYSFINIGRFNYNSVTDSIQIMGSQCYAYYFIDDIVVSTDSLYAYNYIYTSISDITNKESFLFFPNPVEDLFTIRDKVALQKLSVFNMLGECIQTYQIPNTDTYTIDFKYLLPGTYYISVKREALPPIKRKIIKL